MPAFAGPVSRVGMLFGLHCKSCVKPQSADVGRVRTERRRCCSHYQAPRLECQNHFLYFCLLNYPFALEKGVQKNVKLTIVLSGTPLRHA